MNMEDKKVVSAVRNSLGTTYILIGVIIYAIYYFLLKNSFIGLLLLLAEPIISAIVVIKFKLSKVKTQININNWPKVRSTTIGLLFLLTIILGMQSIFTIITHIVAGIIIYLYLKP